MRINSFQTALAALLERVATALGGSIPALLSALAIPVLAGAALSPDLSGPSASSRVAAHSAGPQPVLGSYDPALRAIELANAELRLTLTHAPRDAARLTLHPLGDITPLIEKASTSLMLEDGTHLDLATGAQPTGEVTLRPVDEPGLGPGLQAQAEAWIDRLGMTARMELTLFEGGPYFTYQLVLPEGSPPLSGLSFLEGTFLPAAGARGVTYLADNDAIEEGTIQEDQIEIPIGQGKPLLLRDGPRSLLMAVLDPSDAPSTFQASAAGRGIAFQWRQKYADLLPGSPTASPRLFVRVVAGQDISEAFAPYRSLMQTLYPPAPLPSWFRHQWISWYLYGMDIDEGKLKSQIDYIASNLSDVGPWSILIDAGWYVAEARPDSDWRNVDRAKFPSGLRSLVDYAHERGVQVVLYFSASYLDDRAEEGNWLGLKGIVDRHPEWLVPIHSGDPWRAFYYDYTHPGFQDYLRQLLHDFFVEYGVDGIKVDGMMDSRLAVERGLERGLYTPDTRPVLPSTSVYGFIYREAAALRPDVYLEAGWQMPAFSAPHFTLARQSDDQPDFDSPYPAPGLRDHVDYAIAQRLLLGQRPHLGNFWGDPNTNPIGLQWLEAGLALGAPVVLGFDLPSLSSQALGDYRSRLARLRPFAGQVHIPGGLGSDSFSATWEGTTFLALFNRGEEPREIRAELADHGLPEDDALAGYDVAGGSPLRVQGEIVASVEPRTLRLFVLRSEPGVLWTDSSFQVAHSPGRLALEMSGPSDLDGFAQVVTPRPGAVLLNGELMAADSWSYDAQAGVLSVEYPHGADGTTSLEIQY